MAIHGRFWTVDYPNLLTVERMAILGDIARLDGRKPDKVDREAIKRGCYVVCKALDDSCAGREELYDVGRLRADGGWSEIHAAIEAAKIAHTRDPRRDRDGEEERTAGRGSRGAFG